MASPQNDSYSVASGAGIYIGKGGKALPVAARTMNAGDLDLFSTNGLDVSENIYQLEQWHPNEGQGPTIMHDWCSHMVYDPIRRKAYVCGAPPGNTQANTILEQTEVTILVYDLATNTWSAIRNPWDNAVGHCYDSTCLDYNKGILYKASNASSNNQIYRYDVVNNQALSAIDFPTYNILGRTSAWNAVKCLEYFPSMGEEGAIIWINDSWGRVLKYDIKTKAWSGIVGDLSVTNQHIVCQYHPGKDVIVFTGGSNATADTLWMLDNQGNLSTLDDTPFGVSCGSPSPIFVPNPDMSVNEMLLFPNGASSPNADGSLYSLDLDSGSWTDHGNVPAPFYATDEMTETSIGVAIPEYNAVLLERYASNGNSTCYLYRHST